MTLETLPPLLPLHFFQMALEAKRGKKFALPKTSDLLGEDHFADVYFTWTEEGIKIEARVKKTFEEAIYPDFSKGDCIEICLDTRDLKTAGFATKFCHHFLFLPKEVQGVQCQEITRFRTEDTHPLCDPKSLSCSAEFSSRAFSMEIFLPKSNLHGYDPASFDRLGFTYRVHRTGGPPQHFSVSSQFYKMEQSPSLWSSIKLS